MNGTGVKGNPFQPLMDAIEVTSLRHRSIEKELGYYDFGKRYIVFADREAAHRQYTGVHERTHANIGCGSTFGIFQQFLAFLAFRGPPRMSRIGQHLFQVCLEETKDIHEAAATYAEFATAESHRYVGLSDMVDSLPIEYVNWKATYDQTISRSLPAHERAHLAELIARYAMCTNVFPDFETITDQNVGAFEAYVSLACNSPRQRFRQALDFIQSTNQQELFRNFLSEYGRQKTALLEALTSRDMKSRRTSFAIQRKILDAFDLDSLKIPGLGGASAAMEYWAAHSNRLVEGWRRYAASQNEDFTFTFSNTDTNLVDELDSHETIVFNPVPQPTLYPLPTLLEGLSLTGYVASILAWDDDEPFLLSSSPERWLKKNEVYVRLLPIAADHPVYFLHTSDVERQIPQLLRASPTGVISHTAKSKTSWSRWRAVTTNSTAVFVYWESLSRFLNGIDEKEGCELGFFHLDPDLVIAVIRLSGWHHFLLTDQIRASLIVDELSAQVSSLPKLTLSEQQTTVLHTISRYAHHVL